MQNAEGRVIVAGDGNRSIIHGTCSIKPNEQSVLGDTRRPYEPLKAR
jgi:hypothetical protein